MEECTKEGDWKFIIATVESCLDYLINSVENGTVTVATLEFLGQYSSQFLKLGEVHQTNENVSVSIKDSFSRRRSELKAFLTLRDHLECFIHFSNNLNPGMSVIDIL